jgi:hypothetical protein
MDLHTKSILKSLAIAVTLFLGTWLTASFLGGSKTNGLGAVPFYGSMFLFMAGLIVSWMGVVRPLFRIGRKRWYQWRGWKSGILPLKDCVIQKVTTQSDLKDPTYWGYGTGGYFALIAPVEGNGQSYDFHFDRFSLDYGGIPLEANLENLRLLTGRKTHALWINPEGSAILACEGLILTALPDSKYESWELIGSFGLHWTCTPGGDVTWWKTLRN